MWALVLLRIFHDVGGGGFRIVLKKRNKISQPGRRGYFENICLHEEGYCKIHE
jgi:hypothetical protein